jgi:KDO2-lipid IV(A) lauroyltransferase
MPRKNKTRSPLRTGAEFIALLIGVGWITILPRRAVLWFSKFTGNLAYRIGGKSSDIARQNLDLVFGDTKTKKEKEAILLQSYRCLALLVIDMFWFSRHPHRRLNRWVEFDPQVDTLIEQNVLLLQTGHIGNWEVAGKAYCAKGNSLISVAAPIKNLKIDQLFLRMRQQTGQVILPQRGAMKGLLYGLREKKQIAVLLDQNTQPKNAGIFVPFFGLPVAVSSVPAALAIRTKASVATFSCIPDETGRYYVKVYDIISPNDQAENPVETLTARMTQSLEALVLEHPGHWCWMYKRWRNCPPGADPSQFPKYAGRTRRRS